MENNSKKLRDMLVILLIYIAAIGIGYALCRVINISNTILSYFVFDIIATVIVFVFSVAFHNSSVYDPYWSLVPMVMSIYLFIESGAFGFWQILFLLAFNLWSARLTINWIIVSSGFSYEDWRYRKFRDENGPFMWFIINFFGIHMVPTLVVFAGMLPIFEIAKQQMNWLCLFGIAIILIGISLEIFADRQMHAFLNQTKEKSVCKNGLWNYSRHPNYLGEMLVWVGTYVTMIPFATQKWYYIIGMLSMILLFNFISVPLMEKRQLARRPDYAQYKKETSRIIPLPKALKQGAAAAGKNL